MPFSPNSYADAAIGAASKVVIIAICKILLVFMFLSIKKLLKNTFQINESVKIILHAARCTLHANYCKD